MDYSKINKLYKFYQEWRQQHQSSEPIIFRLVNSQSLTISHDAVSLDSSDSTDLSQHLIVISLQELGDPQLPLVMCWPGPIFTNIQSDEIADYDKLIALFNHKDYWYLGYFVGTEIKDNSMAYFVVKLDAQQADALL